MTKQAQVVVPDHQAQEEMNINARLALLVRDALNPRLNVRRCRIILDQRILTHRDLLWRILVSSECDVMECNVM
jgi:hypothetical protein